MESFFIKRHIRPRKYKTKEKLSMNPLRYPGAKSKLFKYIKTLIAKNELNGCTFYEPFAGSATLSWQLLDEGLISQAVINEKDPLLYHFWKSVFFHTDELVNMIKKMDINIDTWNECVRYKEDAYLSNKETYQIGFAGLFLNRTNFSGILKAGPIGGKAQTSKYKLDCRFNKELWKKKLNLALINQFLFISTHHIIKQAQVCTDIFTQMRIIGNLRSISKIKDSHGF